jgi:hypothetical protein
MSANIYRYKLSDGIYDIIIAFAKLHQYDERKEYKEAWKVLVESKEEEFSDERERLMMLGYKGDVLDKMYKSGRYYFKSKSPTKNNTGPTKKEFSMKLSKYMLDMIESHISSNDGFIKPADRYDAFCKDHKETIVREMEQLKCVEKDLMAKIKKSYKNKYFTIQKKKHIS